MSKRPWLLIITGAPAAGKTTIARRLSQECMLPLFVRDDLKECLFDSLGWSDREWSAKLGAASWELLYLLAERVLVAGHSVVLESNFQTQWATARVAALQAHTGCRVVQILCRANPDILLARYQQRVENGERHPGHVDHFNFDAMRVTLQQEWLPLDVGGELITIDTNDLASIDYPALCRQIQSYRADFDAA